MFVGTNKRDRDLQNDSFGRPTLVKKGGEGSGFKTQLK